jgi:predicted cobalt transporter CbtA
MFLWRGSPDATLVQRIGAWLLGVTFLGLGIAILMLAREAGSRLIGAAGLSSLG